MMEMENKLECSFDKLTDDDRAFMKRLNGNEKAPWIDKRIDLGDCDLVAVRHLDECWTLTGNPNFPKGLTFMVRTIKDAIADPKSECLVLRLPLNQWLYDRTMPNCEEDHVASLDAERMDKIGIIVMLPDETVCMIDGNHRLCARWRAGKTDMRVVMLDFKDIKDEATFIPGERPDIQMIDGPVLP